LGGLLGYAIGLFLFETIGQWVLQFYGLTDAFAGFELKFQQWGWWLVLMAGFTPFPYKVITIASGVFHLNIPIFIAASIISRGGRFFIEAVLLYHYGEKIRRFIDRYFGLLTILFFVLLLGGFAVIKLWV
jgi:membrane protein YqaA with SNARE-associated domain